MWSEPAHIWLFVSLAETLDADIWICLKIINIIINQVSLFSVRSHHHVLFGPLCITGSIRWVWRNRSSCWVFLLLLLRDKLHVGSWKKHFLEIRSDWAVLRSPCNNMQMCLSDGENVFLVHRHLHSRPAKLSPLWCWSRARDAFVSCWKCA